MFDQAMWIAYLSLGVACGLLGVMCWQLALREPRSASPLHLTSTTLLAFGAFCAWMSPVVGLPGHTTPIVVLTALIGTVTTFIVLVTQRAAFNKRLRMGVAMRRGH